MKEKILLLINKRLENITHENIFHDFEHSYSCNFYPRPPIHEVETQKRYTTINKKTETMFGPLVGDKIDVLKYQLIFEDGEPNISVSYEVSHTKTTTENVQKRFLRKNITTTIEDYIFSYKTIIRFGHVKIELTDEESQELMDATIKAYACHLKLKEDNDDKILMDKLDLRLK